MRKKIVCLFIALICALSVCFTACSQTAPTKESSGEEFDYSLENEFPLQDMTEAIQSYEAALGGLMGNDEVGYTMLGRSVMTTVDDTVISADRNFEVSFNLKLARHSNNLGFRVGINASLGDNNNIITGYCLTLAYQQDTGKIQLFGENISSWAKITDRYDVAESLAAFDWDRTYSLKFRWVGNEITIWLDGNEVARGSNSVDRTVAPSKLYFWNIPDSNAMVSDIVITDVASFAADSGEVTGNDSTGYMMNGRSVMSLAEDTVIAPEDDYEISMNVKFDRADSVNFRIGINATEGDNQNIVTGYCLTLAWQNDTQEVDLFGENISDWSMITHGPKYPVSEGISLFDWDKTYALKLTWIGNTLTIYLDGEEIASGSNGVDRSVAPSELYIWNAEASAVTHVSDIRIIKLNDFKKAFGAVSGDDDSGYILDTKSAITQTSGGSLTDVQISFDFSVAAKGWPDLRVMLGGTINEDANGFTSATGQDGISISVTSDGQTVSLGIQSRNDWKSYFSTTLCTYEEFAFDTDYTLTITITGGNQISVKIGTIDQQIILDDDENITAESELYLWNNSTQDTTVKNILVSYLQPTEPTKSFESAFGTVSGNDGFGYTLDTKSAIVLANESSIVDMQISFDFSVAAKGWPDLRVMLGGTVNVAGNGFTSATGQDGVCISITSDGNTVTLGIQSRNDWKSYYSVTLCAYDEFNFDTNYTLTIKITDGNKITVTLGDISKEVVLDEDEMVNAESKLYLWNNSTQVTAIKNILISETAV